MRRLPLAVLLLGLVVALALPAAADASSIVFTRPDGNVWLINPDGSGLFQVTLDGSAGNPYETASQADDGTIVAARGAAPNTQLIRMTQNGTVLSAFRPAVELALGLNDPQISPDGTEVAYSTGFFGNLNCDNGSTGNTPCVSTHVTASNGATDEGVNLVGNTFPSWASGDRLLVAGDDNYISTFDFGDASAAHWFTTGTLADAPSDPDLAATGSHLATTISHANANDRLQAYDATGNPRTDSPPPTPTARCLITGPAGGQFINPSWAPDGSGLVWEEGDGDSSTAPGTDEGLWIWNTGADLSTACGSFSNSQLIQGGSHPDWGPANINPAPRSGPPQPPPQPPPLCCAPPPHPVDRTAPAFQGSVAISPNTFAAAGTGGSVARAHIGTTVTFRISEAATVTFTVERPTAGRKVGRRCVAPTRSNRRKRRCTRYVAVRGSFVRSARAGSNSFKFTGRMGGRKLAPGSYQLVAVAKDAAGNRSAAKRSSFRIVRR